MSELFAPVDDDYYEVEPQTIPFASEVEALQDAGWHLRQLRHLRKRQAELNDLYQREIERIEAWHADEALRIAQKIAWHEHPLRQLSERLYEADPKRKTVRLADGALKLRVYEKAQATIDDNDAILAWAKVHWPNLLRSRVAVSDLRRETTVGADGKVILTATGEVVPGASGVVPEPTWSCDTEVE